MKYFEVELKMNNNSKIKSVVDFSFLSVKPKYKMEPFEYKIGGEFNFVIWETQYEDPLTKEIIHVFIYEYSSYNGLMNMLYYSLGKHLFELYGKHKELDKIFENNFLISTIYNNIKDEKIKRKLKEKYIEEMVWKNKSRSV